MKNSKLIPTYSGQNSKLRKFKICNLKFAICNSRRDGFTLVELMIAITITVLAMAAVYATFIVQQRSFTTQDQVAEADVSSKIAFNLLLNDIRTAGFGYPDSENPAINTFTGAITVNPAAGANNSDTINLIAGFRQIARLNAATNGSNQITISYCTVYPCSSTTFNKTNKRNLSIDGIAFAVIDDCTVDLNGDCLSAPSLITLDREILTNFPIGRPIYLVEDVTYQIVTDTNGVNNLQRVIAGGGPGNVDTIANNIDDLQAVLIDEDGDGDTDRIRVSLLARTSAEDLNLSPATKPYFPNITLEGNVTSENDRIRRRIWSMEIALRN